MKQRKAWAILSLILGAIFIIFVLYWSFAHASAIRTHSKAQLEQSTSRLNRLKNQLDASFENQFRRTGAAIATPECTELGGVTFTRSYDCTSGFTANYVSGNVLSDKDIFDAINAYLSSVNASYAGYDNSFDTYKSDIADSGSWNNMYTIPNSGIKGVLPTQSSSSDGKWLDAININVSVKRSQDNAEISFSTAQEYAACQSFFIPCDSFITK